MNYNRKDYGKSISPRRGTIVYPRNHQPLTTGLSPLIADLMLISTPPTNQNQDEAVTPRASIQTTEMQSSTKPTLETAYLKPIQAPTEKPFLSQTP